MPVADKTLSTIFFLDRGRTDEFVAKRKISTLVSFGKATIKLGSPPFDFCSGGNGGGSSSSSSTEVIVPDLTVESALWGIPIDDHLIETSVDPDSVSEAPPPPLPPAVIDQQPSGASFFPPPPPSFSSSASEGAAPLSPASSSSGISSGRKMVRVYNPPTLPAAPAVPSSSASSSSVASGANSGFHNGTKVRKIS